MWLQLSTAHCILVGFCSGHLYQALGRQSLGPQPCFAEQNLKPGFLGPHLEKTEGPEVRHGSSSLAAHPQPEGPDAVDLGHQETARFVQLQELWGQNKTCSWMRGRL